MRLPSKYHLIGGICGLVAVSNILFAVLLILFKANDGHIVLYHYAITPVEVTYKPLIIYLIQGLVPIIMMLTVYFEEKKKRIEEE